MLKIALFGATGKMGLEIIKIIQQDTDLVFVGGTTRSCTGQDHHGICLTHNAAVAIACAEVVIDFSLPDAVAANVCAAIEAKIAYVCGVTGLSEEQMSIIQAASQHIPVLWAANMSIGVEIMRQMVQAISAKLPTSFDIEILEMHHRDKVDCPSGTAIMMGKAASSGRHLSLETSTIHTRSSSRTAGEIGFASLRGGKVAGDCEVIFAGDHEVLSIKHSAIQRSAFACGAISAARWLTKQHKGLYSISDMLD